MKVSRDSWHFRVYEKWSQRKYKKGYDERKAIVDRSKVEYDRHRSLGDAWDKKYFYDLWQDSIKNQGNPTLNLCPYVRTIMFYAPFRWFFQGNAGSCDDPQDLLKVPFVWTAIIAAVTFFAIVTYHAPLVVGAVIGAVVLGIAGIVGLLFLGMELKDRHDNKKMEAEIARQKIAPTVPESEEPGLFISWIHAKHEKICPQIEITTKK